MSELNLSLHPSQAKVFYSRKRFKVIAAGRRFGKTYLAIAQMAIWGISNKTRKRDIFYVAPTFQQAKDIVWEELKELLKPILATTHENTGVATLINGVKIHLKGSDRPDTLRGVGLIGVVIDEYADMKPNVWEEIIRPALADVAGPAMFIGTPKGRNHFYYLAEEAKADDTGQHGFWHFTTYDNPFIPKEEIDNAKRTLSSAAFRQEFLASFEAPASDLFKEEWLRFETLDLEAHSTLSLVTADLAGFADEGKQRMAKHKWLDDTAIARSYAYRKDTDSDADPIRIWVQDVDFGRWTVADTGTRLIRAARALGTQRVGVEKGIALQAIQPVLPDLMLREGWSIQIDPLSHGNKNKTDRVVWALQGRIEHGTLTFADTPGNRKFAEQLMQFPDSQTHDDLVDAVAYTAQVVDSHMQTHAAGYVDTFQPLDPHTGY